MNKIAEGAYNAMPIDEDGEIDQELDSPFVAAMAAVGTIRALCEPYPADAVIPISVLAALGDEIFAEAEAETARIAQRVAARSEQS